MPETIDGKDMWWGEPILIEDGESLWEMVVEDVNVIEGEPNIIKITGKVKLLKRGSDE